MFGIPLWLVLVVVPSYVLMSFVAYHVERRVIDPEGEDEDAQVLYAAFWPLRMVYALAALALTSVYFSGVGIAKMFRATDGMVDRMLERRRIRKMELVERCEQCEQARPPKTFPQVTIPEGATLGSEEYRKLKPMMAQYESKLPVCERE